MNLKDNNLLLVFGMLLTIAILLGRCLNAISFVDFFEGFFYGLSVLSKS